MEEKIMNEKETYRKRNLEIQSKCMDARIKASNVNWSSRPSGNRHSYFSRFAS